MSDPNRYRYRIEYAKTNPMRFTGHLDVLRAWERTFRRAKLPLAYTQGFNPHPRINLSAALPLGFTSECELMDIWLTEEFLADDLKKSIQAALPPGLEIQQVAQMDVNAPKLQKEIVAAVYQIHLDPFPQADQLNALIDDLLASSEIIRERRGKSYNLRPLIESLSFISSDADPYLRMHLRLQEAATGRPEEVLLALKLNPLTARFHRKHLLMEDPKTVAIN